MKMFVIAGILSVTGILLLPLMHFGLYVSHDGINHVARFSSYFKAFTDGQFPPRWAGGSLNHGYGSPLFLFFYPLPGYLASMLHLLGFSYEASFMFLMGISLIGMGITWYIWMKELYGKTLLAVCSAILYVVVPYHLVDVYVRGDIGEVMSFVFLPLVFWAVERQSKKALFIGAVSYALVLLSHNVMSLIFTPVLLLYIFGQTKSTIIRSVLMLGAGLGLSAFFWVPALIESKYLNTALYIGDVYKQHFLQFSKLIYSPWGFGPDVHSPGGLSVQLGIIYTAVLIGCVIIFWKKLFVAKHVVFWMIILLCALFFTLPMSDIFWSHIAIMRHFQFPWRFMGLASFAMCVVITHGFSKVRNMFVVMLTICLIGSIIPFARVDGYVHHSDLFYQHFSGTTYFHGEATSLWVAGDPTHAALSPIAIVAGNGTVSHFSYKTQQQTFTIFAENPVRIVANTVYFPGWKVLVDGKKTPIEFQDMRYRGLITFYVPKGQHSIRLLFTETPIRLLADGITIISFLLVAGYLLMYKRYQWEK